MGLARSPWPEVPTGVYPARGVLGESSPPRAASIQIRGAWIGLAKVSNRRTNKVRTPGAFGPRYRHSANLHSAMPPAHSLRSRQLTSSGESSCPGRHIRARRPEKELQRCLKSKDLGKELRDRHAR